MFIRRTSTGNDSTGERYFTYRLVSSVRKGKQVRQVTLLNLGRHFSVASEGWPDLCKRIEEIMGSQANLINPALPSAIEKLAQRYAAQIMSRTPDGAELSEPTKDSDAAIKVSCEAHVSVNVDSLSMLHPRSIGVEHVGLHAMNKLGLLDILKKECSLGGNLLYASIGNIIGRMALPASELATWQWLQKSSGLGELLDVDYESLSHMSLYRASDVLIKHKDQIEAALYKNIQSLFSVDTTITLYDLTNTYFEGSVGDNPQSARGRSKEKRSDCPLVTLALVTDGSGFVRKSRVFPGNVSEAGTLEDMIDKLGVPKGAMVIMDRGIASQANLDWLAQQGYSYLVCKRGGNRQFDPDKAVSFISNNNDTIRIEKCLREEGKIVDLYCHSPGREQKEVGISQGFITRFEDGLNRIAKAAGKGKTSLENINQRIGRLKEKSRGISQHYEINLQTDDKAILATGLTFKQTPVSGGSLTNPGVYCLSTNETGWSEEKLWRTYMTLTDLEAVFRSLKSELGMRPVYHRKENRVDGHLFITVLAYQCVQMIRTTLREKQITNSWNSLRKTMNIQRRITVSFATQDGRTMNIRKTSLPEHDLLSIYKALGIDTKPGGTKKLIA